MAMPNLFKRYLLSAFIFKSVLIGGGYTTGRELVEFFLSRGPVTGAVGMLVAATVFSLILAVVFEMARRYRLYDYRSFLKKLLGPGWIAYEVAFLALLVLILSVLSAASGEIVARQFDVPAWCGTAIQMLCIALIVFFGTQAIERFFAGWSFVLYGAFAVFFVWCTAELGGDISAHWRASEYLPGALSSGVRYAGYSMAVIPTMLYCARHFTAPKDAVVSGLLAGPIAMIPAVLFFFAMVARYPAVTQQPVPIVYMLTQLHAPMFHIVFQGVVFGTLIEAGAALTHGFNERLADNLREKGLGMPKWCRAAAALALMSISVLLAMKVGIVNLIAKGYGYSTYAFLALIAIPVFTRGLWLVMPASLPQSIIRMVNQSKPELAKKCN